MEAKDEQDVEAQAGAAVASQETPLPPVDHFEDMNLRQFARYSHRHPNVLRQSVLGPTSHKHESWAGSAGDHLACSFLMMLLLVSLMVAIAVGLVVGLTISTAAWGARSGGITLACAWLVIFVCLVTYMACYGNGLHAPPMPRLLERCGFVCNMRANILCRSIMTCCFNGRADCVGFIMQSEADTAHKKIKQINPPPGGVCWLGDSEFTFWHRLTDDMKEFHSNHINAGFGGSRVIDIQRNVHRLCLDWNPSTVIVHASGNDYDYDEGITAGEIKDELVALLETIAAHPSVIRIGYLLSSRRPVYDDAKWDFMVRVHTLAIHAISQSSALSDTVKILDLRAQVFPMDHFVAVDRVHLNDIGHTKKSKVLLQQMFAVWPKHKVTASTAAEEDENAQ